MDTSADEEYSIYMRCINTLISLSKNNDINEDIINSMGISTSRRVMLTIVPPSMTRIEMKDLDNITIEPGKYYIPNVDGEVSVQYDNCMKGDGYYEVWDLINGEENPDRYMNEEDVREKLINIYNTNYTYPITNPPHLENQDHDHQV